MIQKKKKKKNQRKRVIKMRMGNQRYRRQIQNFSGGIK